MTAVTPPQPTDSALRELRDTAGRVVNQGGTRRDLLERIILAERGLSLGGPFERRLVGHLVAMWDAVEADVRP